MPSPTPPATPGPRWSHDVVEETLGDDARRLSVDVAARLMAAWWNRYAEVVGVPTRRWAALRPTADGPLIELVDGRPMFDLHAWVRFASLAPGAVATPARTAAAFGLAAEQLAPPEPLPTRLVDLVRSRRAARRMRRELRTIEADLARFAAHLRTELVPWALADGEDGTPFAELPAYALAARIDGLVEGAGATWRTPCVLDHAAGAAVDAVLRELQESGADPAAVDRELALRTSGGGASVPEHVAALQDLAGSGDPRGGLDAWLERWGWYALRDVPLEATPLRMQRAEVERWLDVLVANVRGQGVDRPHVELRDPPPTLRDERSVQVRRLVALRERVGQDRACLHAALRALAWTLAGQLERSGALGTVEAAFDLELPQLLALARGVQGDPGPRNRAERRAAGGAGARPVQAPPAGPGARRSAGAANPLVVGGSLRGHPAGAGLVTARAEVVLDATPAPDLAVDGAILVCRHTDPGWMPLLLRCAGVVTERGGPLSHAAIVARELGLPVVTGATGAATRITNAMVLDVDGSAGSVTRVR